MKHINLPWKGIVVCLILFCLTGCGNELEEVEELVAKFDTAVEVAHDVEILYSDSARVRVRIKGPTMLNYLDRNNTRQEFPDRVTVDFFNENGEVESHLTAKYGVRYQNEALVVARDSVVWESTEGEKLETEELKWDERQQKIYTNRFARITRPDEIIYGYGFEANQDFSYSKILVPKGHIKVEEFQNELE